MTRLTDLFLQIAEQSGSDPRASVHRGKTMVSLTFDDEHDLYPERGSAREPLWIAMIGDDGIPGRTGTTKIAVATGDEDADHADLAQIILDVLQAPRVAVD